MAKVGGLEIFLTLDQKALLKELLANDDTMAALETVLLIEQLDWQARMVDQTQGADPLSSGCIAENLRAGTRVSCYANLFTLLRKYVDPSS